MKHKISQEEKFQMMTTAPIPSLIGKMAVPTIISMLITSIYNIADTFFVSRLGTSATASVGIVFPVMAIIQALGFSSATVPEIPSPEGWALRIPKGQNSLQELDFFLHFYAGFA